MRTLFQHAAVLALLSASAACAQIVNPDNMVSPPPRNPASPRATVRADYNWLWQYTQPAPAGRKQALLDDARFRDLLDTNMKQPQAMWGMGTPLSEAARAFLAGEGEVTSTDNRHLSITGCVVDHCAQRGLLWVDLGAPDPLMVFFALRWNERSRTTDQPNAPYTLWLFPTRALDAHSLPQPIKAAAAAFTRSGKCDAPNVTSVLVIEPGGIPVALGLLEAGLQPTSCIHSSGTHL